MNYVILSCIGLAMGLFGGLLGIGGSVIMIPALVLAFGENQHLYQASAMICNFFVGASAVLIHRRADVLVLGVVKWLVPAAAAAVLLGVAVSNSSAFARDNSYVLARIFGVFLIYVIIYNLHRYRASAGGNSFDMSHVRRSVPLTLLCGGVTGFAAGLLGIGGGVLCVPAQQLLLKMPLKRAMANSAATIAAISVIGSFYKNFTLHEHHIQMAESVKIAVVVIPTAVVGALIGSRLMHKLPTQLVRAVFILVAALAAVRMLTIAPAP